MELDSREGLLNGVEAGLGVPVASRWAVRNHCEPRVRPLVGIAHGGIFRDDYQYLVSYKGLAFFTKSAEVLELPAGVEAVMAEKIWAPV